ncbi:MAG: tetratricopeptide repeat protein [Planctomycetes bacterium]|nr:tetratricopeptide repeat protein [Planctomycetota bacterium]
MRNALTCVLAAAWACAVGARGGEAPGPAEAEPPAAGTEAPAPSSTAPASAPAVSATSAPQVLAPAAPALPSAAAPAAAGGAAAAEAKVRQAVALRDAGKLDEALRLFIQAIQLDPTQAGARCGAGQVYQRKGLPKPAIEQFQAAVKLDPKEWRAWAALVQLQQAAGDVKARDTERAALLDLRRKGEVPSLKDAERYCRDRFTANRRKVIVYEYFEPRGERPVLYIFYVLDEKGRKTDYRLTLGSYVDLNLIAQQLKEVGPKERLFHLDGYYPDGTYRPFQRFRGEPPYDEVRRLCVQIITGRAGTTEGVTRGKQGPTLGWDPNSGAMGLAALLSAVVDADKKQGACPAAPEPDPEDITVP